MKLRQGFSVRAFRTMFTRAPLLLALLGVAELLHGQCRTYEKDKSFTWPPIANIQVNFIHPPAAGNPLTPINNWSSAIYDYTCTDIALPGNGQQSANFDYHDLNDTGLFGETDITLYDSSDRIFAVNIQLNSNIDGQNNATLGSNLGTYVQHLIAHELGHTFGLDDCVPCATGESVMYDGADPVGGLDGPNGCDITNVVDVADDYLCSPCPENDFCSSDDPSWLDPDFCTYPIDGCPAGYDSQSRCCAPQQGSPIIIDVDGRGFHLTSADNGVMFDFFGTGKPVRIAWTALGSTNAWLVLDRNGNGKIDDGKEMFGNLTEQPKSPAPNGFLVLAEFDKPQNGGNGDGKIDKNDAVFSLLRLWLIRTTMGSRNRMNCLPCLNSTCLASTCVFRKQNGSILTATSSDFVQRSTTPRSVLQADGPMMRS